MSDEWYISRNAQSFGPLSFERLALLARTGELAKTDLVWQAEMDEWKPVQSINGLIEPMKPSGDGPPPVPPPQQPHESGIVRRRPSLDHCSREFVIPLPLAIFLMAGIFASVYFLFWQPWRASEPNAYETFKAVSAQIGGTPNDISQPSNRFSPLNQITYAAYSRIYEGMSYSEVWSVIGTSGREIASSHVDGVPGAFPSITTKMFSWANPDGSNMNAMFQNDKLITKAQIGLK